MTQDKLINQKIERIGVGIYNLFKKEGVDLDAEDLDELQNQVVDLLAKHLPPITYEKSNGVGEQSISARWAAMGMELIIT